MEEGPIERGDRRRDKGNGEGERERLSEKEGGSVHLQTKHRQS